MSCYEWSHGDIVLPSAAFSAVRKACQEAMHAKWKKAFDDSQRFWQGLTPKQRADWMEFRKALNARRFDDDTMWLIDPQRRGMDRPRRVKQSDIEWPNNRTVDFHESDLSLTFKRETRTLTFAVGENNHAREHADATTLAATFYDQMAKVRWTHGTGGVILGNDEYNREAGYEREGGGGSYVVAAYGYIGAKEAPGNVTEFLNGKGQHVHVETKVNSRTFAVTGKVVAGRAPRAIFGQGGSRAVW